MFKFSSILAFAVLFFGLQSNLLGQIPGVPIGLPIGTGIGIGIKLTATYPLPYANLAADYRSVYLYRASEFGFNPGEIKGIFGIGWDVAVAQKAPLKNFTIRFKEVPWDVMPSNPDMSGATVVYSTPTYVEHAGENYHNFADAYCWDGTKNLAIEVCVTNPPTEHTLNAKVAVFPPFGTEFSSWHEWNNSGLSICDDPGSGNGKRYLNRPLTLFRMLPGNKTDLAAVSSIEPEEVLESDAAYPVDFKVQNLSCNTVDTLVLEYKWMNQPIVSDTVRGIQLQPGQYYTHYFQKDIFADTLGFTDFKLWVNNAQDLNHSNDTLKKLIWVKDADFTGLDYNGKEFWGAFMANYNNGVTLKQYLYITSPNGADVTVSFPLLNWTRSFSVASKELYALEIPKHILQELIANDSSEEVKPTSYFVKANAAITVYGMSTQYQSTDAFLSIPKRSLGYEYKVIAPEGTFLPGASITGGLLTDAPSEFIVVASEDNTEIRIVCPNPTTKHSAGDTIHVTLDQGENFLVKGRVDKLLGLSVKSHELTGSHVLANKRVAVIGGAQCAMIPSQSKLGCQACDHLLEQTPPLNTLGKRFITVDFEYKPGNDFLQVFNPHPTPISATVSGAINQSYTVPANGYKDIAFQGGVVLETSKPAMVSQMCTGGQCLPISMTDPFYTNIISENQWANVFSYATTAGFNIAVHYISVIKRSEEGRIAIDGNIVNPNKFSNIPGTNYYYARLKSTSGAHRITGDSLFVTYVYGFGYDDSYGYPASGALLMPVDAPEIEGFASAIPGKCYNDSTSMAWVQYFGGTAPFVINWDNGMHTDTIKNLSPGRYIVQVVDDYGKSFKDTVWVTAPDTLAFTKSIHPVLCFGDSTGSIDYTVYGGVEPYEIWYENNVGNPINKLPVGEAIVEIKDANGCSRTDTSLVPENPALVIDGSTQMPRCYGGNDGSLTISASGGSAPYEFFINGQKGDSLGNLASGTHLATIVDAAGCQVDSTFVLVEPAAIDLTIQTTSVACYGDSLGSVIFEPSGGSGLFSIIFLGDTSQQLGYKHLPAGGYQVTVDDGFCAKTFQFAIDSIHSPRFSITTEPDKCRESVGAAFAQAEGGTGNYQFRWDASTYTSNKQHTKLSVGNFEVIATDGVCTDTLAYTIQNIPAPTFTYSITPESCDENNARIEIEPINFWQDFSWLIDGKKQSNLISESLDSGYHHITFSDSACNVDSVVYINYTQPFVVTDVEISQPTCNSSNGTIDVLVEEGATAISIQWLNRNEISFSLTDLEQGLYTAIISDAMCSDTLKINLVNIDGPKITTHITDARCNENNGSITVSASEGNGTYNFEWPDIPGLSDATATNLDAGIYWVLVHDDNCTNSVEAYVNRLPMLKAELNTKNEHCRLGDGALIIKTQNVLGTLLYSLDNQNYSEYTDSIYLNEGQYVLNLKDDYCSIDTAFEINTEPIPSLSYSKKDEQCSEATGEILLSGNTYHGTNYFYFGDTISPSNSHIKNLSKGDYFVALSDGYCWDSAYVNIIDFEKPKAFTHTEPDHCSSAVGRIFVDSLQGNGSVTLLFQSQIYSSGDIIENVRSGWQTFTVSDSLCQHVDSVFVNEISGPVIQVDSLKPLSCGIDNGLIFISASGPETSYSIRWDDGSTQWYRENLSAGIYHASIKGQHCEIDTSIVLETLPIFTAQITEGHSAHCNGQKGAADVSYQNAFGQVILDINGKQYFDPTRIAYLPTGLYPYRIQDDYCSLNGNVNIQDGKTIALEISQLVKDTCALKTGAAMVSVRDNVGPVLYSLNGSATTVPLQGLSKGSYTLKASDDFCEDSKSFTILGLDPPSGNIQIDELDACEKSVGAATYSDSSHTLSFLWNGIAGTHKREGLAFGQHQLIVSNAFCSDTLDFMVDEHPDFIVNTHVMHDQCQLGRGKITMDAVGSTAPFFASAASINVPLPYSDTALSNGLYTYTISDRFGCEHVVNISLKNEDVYLTEGKIFTSPDLILLGDTVKLDFWLENEWFFDYWDINGMIDSSLSPSLSFQRPNQGALVELHAVHKNGCTGLLRRRFAPTVVGIVYAPNAFTPNGDGENDTFYLKGENVNYVDGGIFNRWGEEIMRFTKPDDQWDGTYKGNLSPIGVYNYRFIVGFSSGVRKEVTGSIRLIR